MIQAGVNAIIDEEKEVGLHIALKVQTVLQTIDSEQHPANDGQAGASS